MGRPYARPDTLQALAFRERVKQIALMVMQAPIDQAAGLRALFAPRPQARLVPLVDAPGVEQADALIDRLVAAYLERGLRVLVVDAGQRAPQASELARVNLAACIQALGPQVGWLDARGLIGQHLDHRGSAAGLVQRLRDAEPAAEVLLLRAPVAELARVLSSPEGAACRPLLVTDLQQQGLTAAYAATKWLRERADCRVFGLLVAGHPQLKLTQRVARQLADTAERFLGAALPCWAGLAPQAGPDAALRRLAHDSLQLALPQPAADPSADHPAWKPPFAARSAWASR